MAWVLVGVVAILVVALARAEGRRRLAERRVDEAERSAASVLARLEASSSHAALLAGALDGVAAAVVVADGRGQVVFRNQAAHRFLGARPADALAEQVVHELLGVAAAGGSGTRQVEVHGPPPRTLRFSAVALGEGRSVGTMVVVDDVTDRHRTDVMRRDFVANVSHELKTPVGALALLAETLAAEDEPDVVRHLAARLQVEAHRLDHIISDLLDLSRIEAEEASGHEPVPAAVVVSRAVERVLGMAAQRGITLDVDPPAADLWVAGDLHQLVSALANLLDNAVKYSPPGSVVTVTVGRREHHVELSVRDRGMGIPVRDLDRIFERFYRVDRARSRETGGTGLGLSIVRHIVTNHGGEILVESAEGTGSTFTVRLPAVPRPALAPAGGGA